jgi:tetratricopeptide (TPR) repeat protein
MNSTHSQRKNKLLPFLELIKEAEHVEIEEVPTRRGKEFFVRIPPAVPPTSPTVSPKEFSKHYLAESAELLLENGDPLLARHLFSFLLKDNLKDITALKGLGVCFLKLSDYTSAKRCFNALWELYKKEEFLVWQAKCLSHEKKDKEALKLLKSVATPAKLPLTEKLLYFKELGNCYTRQEKWDLGEQAYREALELDPLSDAIHVNLGTLEHHRKHWELSTNYFKRAVELNPSNSKAYCGLAMIAIDLKQWDNARTLFEKSLDHDEKNIVAILQLTQLSSHLKDTSSVKRRILKFLEKDKKNEEVRFALATLLFQERNWQSCDGQLNEILSENPNHIKARSLKEELLSHTKRNIL